MAKFFAFEAADTVGSEDLIPYNPGFASPVGSSYSFWFVDNPVPTEYYVFNSDSPLTGPVFPGSITSWARFESFQPFSPTNIGAGDVKEAWKADSGDTYSTNDLLTMIYKPDPATPGFTGFTYQDLEQFWFGANDRIHGSEEGDMLCGWAGNDKMWGNGGNNKFYFGQGMDKDKIMDFSKANDDLYLDEDFASTFKQLKKMVTYNVNKNITKIKDGGDVLKVYGIDTQKELKSVVHFDDFTDFA
ncbi:MAG: hypothetical protein KDJ88_04975 [Bauldia sp.]|nr:hypothetical protein [Bauldia sp.]